MSGYYSGFSRRTLYKDRRYLNDYSLKECVQMAAATGASCVVAYDALSGLKSFEELEKRIKAGWPKIKM